jgi:hypothetical protein
MLNTNHNAKAKVSFTTVGIDIPIGQTLVYQAAPHRNMFGVFNTSASDKVEMGSGLDIDLFNTVPIPAGTLFQMSVVPMNEVYFINNGGTVQHLVVASDVHEYTLIPTP